MPRIARYVGVALCLLFAGPLAADPADKPSARPQVIAIPHLSSAIRIALEDRRFAEAIRLIDVELKDPKAQGADHLLYLRGRAQTELKLFDQAIATFRKLDTDFPKSEWAPRARFAVAEVFMRQRNYQEAGAIYQREAARLLSAGRRDELAAIYLEFADRCFDGFRSNEKPAEIQHDYQKALEFYQQALALVPGIVKRQQIELRIARCQQELKNLPAAIEAYRHFVSAYGFEAEAKTRAPLALEIEARFQLGQSLLEAGQAAEARKTWQDLLAAPAFRAVGSDRLAQAQFNLGLTYGLPDPSSDGELELGVAALELFLKTYPKHKLAASAELEIAASYGSRGRLEQAIARLRSFIASPAYAASDAMPKARNLLGEILFSQKKFDEAIAVWRAFLAAHPNHPFWKDVLSRTIDAEYAKGQAQLQLKNFDAAREIWESFLTAHPLDERAPTTLFQFGQMKYTQGLDRVKERIAQAAETGAAIEPLDSTAQVLFRQAIEEWRRLVSKYQDSSEAGRAAVMIGVVLEERLGRLSEAIETYKKAGNNDEAKRRLARLVQRQMDVLTPRKFRGKEWPFLRLSTRNIEKLAVKVYRVEMTDYFRKMHLTGGIETLDIGLIDPDKTFEFPIKGYEKYRPFESDVPIPVTGPGVWAVTVSGDALEATTMLVVSDLDVIVKCSRNELFVFAEDVAAQKPAENVRVLVSDGARIFSEATTGKDGVVQKSFEELKTLKDLRVFAVRDGHVASTVNILDGLDFAVGLSPVGHIETDRPAYRHGELVNLKGIVRWVADDRFTFKEGEKYKIEVTDPRGRPIYSSDVKLNRFGTFATSFLLPDSVPQGQCAVRVFQPAGPQSYAAQFAVHEAKLEQIRLEIDLPRRVYYRGEKIEGKIRLKYYYGTPLAGREIRYRLADDRLQTGTTNAAGEFTFELPTRRYSESQALDLKAEFPEQNVTAIAKVFLAATAIDLRVATVRSVYVGGETFDATVTATDPAGEPVAAPIKLEVLEKTSSERHSGDRLIESHEMATDKEKGTARQTLRIAKAGRYVLRATAVDRFGIKVSGSHDILISGDDDDVRLRILADRHNYQTGDTAHVTLHWREEPALALVAYEGASILGYRLVELKKGANPFDVALDSKLAPNFVLSIAVIERTRFHQASSDFAVKRKLRIVLSPDKPTAKPGEPITVAITAADPQGKPVQAELSLAMVQRNLMDLFAEKKVELDQLFGGSERKPSLRTITSCTFLYEPKAHETNSFLLAEERRQHTIGMEGLARQQIRAEAVMRGQNRVVPYNAKDLTFEYLTQEFDVLLRARRYSEAEALARKAQSLDENGAMAGRMLEKARLGRQLAKNSKTDAYLESLVELDSDGLEEETEAERSSEWGVIRQRGLDFNKLGDISGAGGGGMGGGVFGQGPLQKKDKQSRRWSIVGMDSNPQPKLNIPMFGGRLTTGTSAESQKSEATPQAGKLFDTAATPLQLSYSKSEINGYYFFAQTSSGETMAVPGLVPASPGSSPTGARTFPDAALGETGYWNPTIVTAADGKATVTFPMPPRSTAWKLRAEGIDGEALAGQADADVIAKKDLFGEMKLPQAFTAGDSADVLVEIQNSVVEKGSPIDARLKVTLGDRTIEMKKSSVSDGPGTVELAFPASFGEPGLAEFELTVESGGHRDLARAKVPVRPFGLPVFSTASGTAGQSTIAFVEADRGLAPERPQLEILIGPSVNRALLDAVLGSGAGLSGCEMALPVNSLERTASDIFGGVSLLAMMGSSRDDGSPEATALGGRVRSAIAQLVSAQRDDGGWSWSGGAKAAKADRILSSRAAWAFAAARRAGFAVPPEAFDKATGYLSSALAAAAPSERDAQAALFHAMAECGRGDFAIANRLYRERNSLSTSGLLYVALALARLDRREMAGEILDLVKISVASATGAAGNPPGRAPMAKELSGPHNGTEMRALFLLALEQIRPADDRAARLADWLMGARQGSRWNPERANGPAVAALANWFARVKQAREKYTLAIYVNDRLLQKLTVDPAIDATRRLDVPAAMLVAGKPQRINFDMEGRGRFSYSAVLSGFVPAERLAATTHDWSVERWYEPAQRMFDGQLIPRGFDVISGSYTSFRNDLTQLPVGTRGEVSLHIFRRNVRGMLDEQLDYLVVTEPIPGGSSVLADSVRGSFERYEISPGSITFYIGDAPYPGTIEYTLVGYAPGTFRAAPTVVRSFYQPQRIAVSTRKSIDVLPKGAAVRDSYKLTPRELFELGKRLIANGQFGPGAEHLAALLKQYHLRDDVYREAVQALFRAALATGQNPAIVENFEIIKEKLPGIEIDFDAILRVAAAYRALGEYERSFLVYRATVEAAFQRESQIAGFLNDREEFLRSVQVMDRLLHEYPAEAYIATATVALAQEVYGKAGAAAENAELRRAGLTRVDLIAASIGMFDRFLSTWPNDPAADQATFSTVSALLDLEEYEPALARCRRAVVRYPESALIDSFWYMIGYSQFAQGRNDDALETCRKVAEMTRKDSQTGEIKPAENKWQAIYIMGQIYHSLGKPAQAVAEYERVKDKFADAREAIDFFLHRQLRLPEVLTVRPNEAAKIALTYRNIPRVDLKVYRVDLLKFGLVQRNLANITAINLAGIRPYHDRSIDLGTGKDYGDREKSITLPLKEEGAYLVVCRGGDDYASGLVLVSPLELAVQEDADSGRVRVTAKNAVSDRYLRKVHVKVIGSDNSEFISGETDLRGIFTADAIHGKTTVIARADNSRYAFFRGTTSLGRPPAPPAPASQAQPQSDSKKPAEASSRPLLENLNRSKSSIQQQQRDTYRGLLGNRKQGVKAKEAY